MSSNQQAHSPPLVRGKKVGGSDALKALHLTDLFPETVREVHPAKSVLRRYPAGRTYFSRVTRVTIVGATAAYPLDQFFTPLPDKIRDRALYLPTHYPSYAHGIERLQKPLLTAQAIAQKHARIKALVTLSDSALDRISTALGDLYRDIECFSFTWRNYRKFFVPEGSVFDLNGVQARDKRRIALYLHGLLRSLNALSSALTDHPTTQAHFTFPEVVERISKRKSVAPIAEFFRDKPSIAQYLPISRPGPYMVEHHATRMQRNYSYGPLEIDELKRDLLELRYCFGVSMEAVSAIFSELMERVRGGQDKAALLAELEALSQPAESFNSWIKGLSFIDDSSWFSNLLPLLMKHTARIEHALAGVRMLRTGHFTLPETAKEPGVIDLKALWNPTAGSPETLTKFDIRVEAARSTPQYGPLLALTGATEAGKSTLLQAIPVAKHLHEAALPIPAGAGSRISIFGNTHTVTPTFQDREKKPGKARSIVPAPSNAADQESHHTGFVREITTILEKVSPGDLVMIDEGHIGAEFVDLVATVEPLLEELRRKGATVLYATHLREVVARCARRANETGRDPSLALYAVAAEVREGVSHRTLTSGIAAESSSYATLRNAGIPEEILNDASRILALVIDQNRGLYELVARSIYEPARNVSAPSSAPAINRIGESVAITRDREREEKACARHIQRFFPPASFQHPVNRKVSYAAERLPPQWYTIPSRRAELWQAVICAPFTERWVTRQFARRAEPATEKLFCRKLDVRQRLFDKLLARELITAEERQKLREADYDLRFLVSKKLCEMALRRGETNPAAGLSDLEYMWNAALLQGRGIQQEASSIISRIDRALAIVIGARAHALSPVRAPDSSTPAFQLRQLLSPEIPAGDVVPVTISGAPNTSQLLIVGPARTGKTEILKSVRAAVQLDRRGLPIPAQDPILPSYDGVYSLFGAEEDRSEQWSYFRSVSERLAALLRRVTPKSLVILDEIQGADYFELAALLPALLKYLHNRVGCTVIVNSHMKEGILAVLDELPQLRFERTTYATDENGVITPLFGLESISAAQLRATRSLGIETIRHLLTAEQYERAVAIRGELIKE